MGIAKEARLSSRTVRENYEYEEWWTYAECAHYTMRSWETIRQWARTPVDARNRPNPSGRHRWKFRNGVNADKVNSKSFVKYVETGQPQGARIS